MILNFLATKRRDHRDNNFAFDHSLSILVLSINTSFMYYSSLLPVDDEMREKTLVFVLEFQLTLDFAKYFNNACNN